MPLALLFQYFFQVFLLLTRWLFSFRHLFPVNRKTSIGQDLMCSLLRTHWALYMSPGFSFWFQLHVLSSQYSMTPALLYVYRLTNYNFQMYLVSWEVLHKSKSYFLMGVYIWTFSSNCGKTDNINKYLS